MGKGKVVFKKVVIIFCLDLCVVVFGIEIFKIIKEQLDIDFKEMYFYIDSKVVFGYIYNRIRRFYIYVSN